MNNEQPTTDNRQPTTAVGVVKQLYRYPVKSMRGEALETARVWWQGVEGDRRFAFVCSDDRSSFPWLTGRDVPALIRYVPSFIEPTSPVESPVRVHTPEGRDVALESEELRAELMAQHGGPIHLIQLGRGTFDSAALSLISTTTLQALGHIAQRDLDPRRFRPNILVDLFDLQQNEDDWVGGVLRFGDRADSAQMRVDRKDQRCMMLNLDPETARQTPEALRAVVSTRANCAGVYGTPVRTGTVRVGDYVYLEGKR
jgi:uncharacterized protein YcbX